jgi:hypothetical protein
MKIAGVYIFKSDSGITLYSRRTVGVEEDLFSAFLSALKGFFSSFSLGGLSSFASENFIIYLASANNVLTALIVENNFKSDKYFSLAYEICLKFYENYKKVVDSQTSIHVPNKEAFDAILDAIVQKMDKNSENQQEFIKLYNVSKNGELEIFEFTSEDDLYKRPLFIVANFVTKQIFVIENPNATISSRLLFLANKSITNLNANEFKSEFTVRNVSDSWDLERVIKQVSTLLLHESIKI